MLKIGDKVKIVKLGSFAPARLLGLEGTVQQDQKEAHRLFDVYFPGAVIRTGLKDGEDDGVWPMYAEELEVIE